MKYELNNIYCVDSYKAIKDISDKSIDLIVTDPPYQIEGLSTKPHGIFSSKGHSRKYEQEMLNTNLGKGIDLKILDEFVRILKKINIYLWCNKEQIYDYLAYFVKERKCNWEMIIWSKDNVPPFTSGHYLKDKEYCLYFWEKGVKVNPTFETGKTVYLSKVNIEDKKQFGHPTIKPLDIIKNLIKNSSGGGAIVLDTFSGSGTTCVAAKELGRKYLGFEIDEHYWKISVDRLNGINKNGQTSLLDTDFEQLSLLEEE